MRRIAASLSSIFLGVQSKREVGGLGEDLAAAYLEKQGYEIRIRNVRMRSGEIDIIATLGKQLVFVEVKYRRGVGFGNPEESVDRRKIEHLRSAIAEWCGTYSYRGSVRLDVLAITDVNGTISYRLFTDVLTA